MCLFRKEDQEGSCTHEECKNYYLLNNQICMHSKQSQSAPTQNISSDEQENLLDVLQKKIKKEDSETGARESQSSSFNSIQNNTNLLSNPFIMAHMMQSTLKSDNPTTNSSGVLPTLQSMHQSFPFLGHPGLSLANTGLSQLFMLKQQDFMNSLLLKVPKFNEPLILDETRGDQNNESSNIDFQNKLFNMISSQNKLLVELKEKNNSLQDTIAGLMNEVSTLKSCIKNPSNGSLGAVSINSGTVMGGLVENPAESINTSQLLTYLYGPNFDFPYQLVLKQDLGLPLYRERNFNFTVLLVDKKGNFVENTNRIPLALGIYSSENPPKFIESNTSGNKILKGFIEKDLVYGKASFEKIQIKEVTSHFRSGWVFFAVYPKVSSSGNIVTFDGNMNSISSQKIKPLILEKVVVKAKKMKEKQTSGAEAEENDGDEME